MILDQLVLSNIGVFAGRNEIDLTPPSPDKPVIIVGGLNGAGKTTTLEAIQLALYGPLAAGAARRSGGYESYLRSLIHQPLQDQPEAGVELAFHAFHEGVPRNYRVRRSWMELENRIRERLTVWVDGEPDHALAEGWGEYVEGFLPRGISGLFFFDGEQIESLANLERSRQVLRSALAALLGLDLVDRLTADLAVLRRRHRPRQLPDELRQRVEETKAAAARAREAERVAFDDVAKARTIADLAAKWSVDTAEKYRANGGDLFEQREGYESRAAELRKERSNIDDELRDVAAGSAPLLQINAAMQELASRARSESVAVREQVVLNVLDARDIRLLSQLRTSGATEELIVSVNDFLSSDRDQHRDAASAQPVTGLADPAPVEFLISQALPDAKRRLQTLLARRGEVEASLDAAERLLEAIPHPEALAPLRTEFEQAGDELLAAEAALAHAEEQLKSLGDQRERAVAAYEKAMDESAHASLAVDDDRRLVDHSDRARVTLEALKVAATQRHVDRISALVLQSLKTLMRKENLITEIAIDPVSYAVELRGSTGQPLSSEQLSVGERQMLAVALLWGLARAAGQPLPVVIDTPLGRLDSSHRHHLLERYFPHASHQVILLSTDTEITDEAWEQLAPSVGRSYRLEFDPAAGATTVRSGYFWES